MWTIWILIILKYTNGYMFLETESLREIDFNTMVTKDERSDTSGGFNWGVMFINDTSNSNNNNFTFDENDNITGIYNNFFTESNNNLDYSPFVEIKKYDAWYWGSSKSTKPRVKLINNIKYTPDMMQLKKSCPGKIQLVDESEHGIKTAQLITDKKKEKIKVIETSSFYKLFSTDKAKQTLDINKNFLTPFQQWGNKKITFLRPHEYIDHDAHPLFRTYKPVGDIVIDSKFILQDNENNTETTSPSACNNSDVKYKGPIFNNLLKETVKTILVSGDTKPPIRYKKIWSYTRKLGLNKNSEGFTVWKPIPPSGYKALGLIIDTRPFKSDVDIDKFYPSTDLIACVPDNYDNYFTKNINTADYIDNFWRNQNTDNQNTDNQNTFENLDNHGTQTPTELSITKEDKYHLFNSKGTSRIIFWKTIKDLDEINNQCDNDVHLISSYNESNVPDGDNSSNNFDKKYSILQIYDKKENI